MSQQAKLEYDNGIIRAYTPYNARFVADIKKLPQGTRLWNKQGKYWAIDVSQEDKLYDIVSRYYDITNVEGEEIETPGHIRTKIWELKALAKSNIK